jgi:glutamyl-tRNA synthetase
MRLLPDFVTQASYFFNEPSTYDMDAIKPKWNEAKLAFFNDWKNNLSQIGDWDAATLETSFKELATEKNIKPGELQLPLRIMLVGAKFGPTVFEIAALIGKDATIQRINKLMQLLD